VIETKEKSLSNPGQPELFSCFPASG